MKQVNGVEIVASYVEVPFKPRDHNRNYLGTNGREVYWRSRERHGCTKAREGWVCSYCARFEGDCICPPSQRKQSEKEGVGAP